VSTKRILTASLLGCLLGIACYATWRWRESAPERRADTHLTHASASSRAAIDARLKPLSAFFARARRGTKPFASEALSWGGKWAMVQGYLPWTENDTHKKYVSEAFARHVFDPQDLQKVMEGSIRDYLGDLEAVENRLLVGLRADLADLDTSGQGTPTHLQSDEAFRKEYRLMADKVVAATRADVGILLGREIGTLVASEVATQIVMQATRVMAGEMGLGAGILGTGAASAVASLGVGMVIAFVLDYVLDAVFRMAGYDPVAKISDEVKRSLDKMEAALTKEAKDAKAKPGALRAQMLRLHDERAGLRRATVALILEGGKK
jgi:hypothetical protein